MAEIKIDISEIVDKAVDKLIETGWRPPEWIPCSEQMPEKHTEVLAYSPFWGEIVVAMWGGEFWLVQWTDDDLQQSEITHWMPLPEPPESEVQDEAEP